MFDNYESISKRLSRKSRQDLEQLREILTEEVDELGERPGSEGFVIVNDSILQLKRIVVDDLLEKKKHE